MLTVSRLILVGGSLMGALLTAYVTAAPPGKNYEDTLIDVKTYADSESIPYKYVLLDSWWYYQGEGGGVTNWVGRPDVFPHGKLPL